MSNDPSRRIVATLVSVAIVMGLFALAAMSVRQDTRSQKWQQDCLKRGGVPVSHYKVGTSGRELVAVCQEPKVQP